MGNTHLLLFFLPLAKIGPDRHPEKVKAYSVAGGWDKNHQDGNLYNETFKAHGWKELPATGNFCLETLSMQILMGMKEGEISRERNSYR